MRISDWSSDVCSSDLEIERFVFAIRGTIAYDLLVDHQANLPTADRRGPCASGGEIQKSAFLAIHKCGLQEIWISRNQEPGNGEHASSSNSVSDSNVAIEQIRNKCTKQSAWVQIVTKDALGFLPFTGCAEWRGGECACIGAYLGSRAPNGCK